ncbi:MAG: arginine--tRNA ligase, partial [Verrucomicrobiales bacterium]
MTLQQEIEVALRVAFEKVLGDSVAAPVVASADLRFGDYQSNAAMALAKKLRTNPRALAEQVIDALELDTIATAEIAGPGFINFRVLPSAFAER